MDTYARAPDDMYTKAVAGAIITEFTPVTAATILETVLCRRCQEPYGEWDTLHPLFRSWSTKCPACHTRDIQLDFAHQNNDDA